MIALALSWPTWGLKRLSLQLAREGIEISPSAYRLLRRVGLGTRRERLGVLEGHAADNAGLSTQRTRDRLRRAKRPLFGFWVFDADDEDYEVFRASHVGSFRDLPTCARLESIGREARVPTRSCAEGTSPVPLSSFGNESNRSAVARVNCKSCGYENPEGRQVLQRVRFAALIHQRN